MRKIDNIIPLPDLNLAPFHQPASAAGDDGFGGKSVGKAQHPTNPVIPMSPPSVNKQPTVRPRRWLEDVFVVVVGWLAQFNENEK